MSHAVQGQTGLSFVTEIKFFTIFPCNSVASKRKVKMTSERRWIGRRREYTGDCIQSSHIIRRRVPLFSGLKLVISWGVLFSLHLKKKKKSPSFVCVCCFHELVWELRNKVNSRGSDSISYLNAHIVCAKKT